MNLVKKNKKLIVIGAILLVLTLGVSFAYWTYSSKTSDNHLIAGDIYMKYTEDNTINMKEAMPSITYDPTQYFQFKITGKNNYKNKDIVYDISLDYGKEPDAETGRTKRIKDELLRFRLVEIKNGKEEELIQNGSYSNLQNKRIWIDRVSKNTTEEVDKTYRLYMWVSNDVKIGNMDGADYSAEVWNNQVFASINVNVTGDFEEKELTDDYLLIHATEIDSNQVYDLNTYPMTDEDVKVTLGSKRKIEKFIVNKVSDTISRSISNQEYTASYNETTNAWEAEVTISETGTYEYYAVYQENKNSSTYTFKININPDRYTLVEKPTVALCKTGLVYNGETQNLVENPDQDGYTFLEYQQTDAGTYQVKAHLKDKYRWSDKSLEDVSIDCSIEKATPVLSLSSESGEVLEGKEVEITASVEPQIEGTYEAVSNQDTIAKTEVDGNQITVTGVSNGEAVITVTFKPTDNQNYNNSESKTYSVNGYKIATEAVCSNPTYNGALQPLAAGGIGIELQNNSMKDANTYQVTEKLIDGYRWSDNTTLDKTLSCTINPKTVANVTVNLGPTDFTYNGGEHQPTVTSVLDGSIPLTLTTDYKVSYSNNTNAGTNTAKVIITGQNNYTGTKEVPFTIKQVQTTLSYEPPSLSIEQGSSGIVTINANNIGTWNITSNSMPNAIVSYSPEVSASKVVTVQGVAVGSTTLSITFTPTDITNYTSKTETYSVTIINPKVADKLKNDITSHTTSEFNPTIEEDGTIYLSGTNDQINFNYVWYSGKLWRITAINPDNTIKMITQDEITAMNWGSSSTYKGSWIYQWLNEDFLDTLYNQENIIVQNAKWNATADTKSSIYNMAKPETLGTQTIVEGNVGSLNAYEYYQSYKKLGTDKTAYGSGYLNIGYYWWLITPNDSSRAWYVTYEGQLGSFGETSPTGYYVYGVRPSINLRADVKISGGEGTKENPYRIEGDKAVAKVNTDKLNSRVSGEYVNFDGKKYRIVGIENGITKLTSVDYIRDATGAVITKYFGSRVNWADAVKVVTYPATYGRDDFWSYYLSNSRGWYNSINETYKNMMIEGTYYLGEVPRNSSGSYKGAICSSRSTKDTTKTCSKTSSTWTGLVGLPRVGEMFSAMLGNGYTDTTNDIWLITPQSVESIDFEMGVRYISRYGYLYASQPYVDTSSSRYVTDPFAVRPSINLKSDVVITSGEGTNEKPYELSCTTCTETSSPSAQEGPTIFDDNVGNNTKNIATTGTCNNLVYNGETQTLVSGGGNTSYENNNQSEAGTYQVTAKANTGYTFSDGTTTKTLDCNINKKIIPVSFNTNILKYNGTYQSPVATATGVKGEVIELETTKEKELGEFTTIATMKNVNPNYSLSNTVLDYKITNTNESNKITNITKVKINYYLKNKDIDSYSLVKGVEQDCEEGETVTGNLINFTNYKTPASISIKIIKGLNVIDYYYERI